MAIRPFDKGQSSGGGSGTGVTSVNGKSGPSVTITKSDLGLQYVQNVAPADLPVSTATQTAITAEHDAMVAQIALCLKNADKGAASGIAPLNASGKLSSSYLEDSITSGLKWQSTYNASTGLPTIAVPSVSTAGYFWKVDTAGTQTINGTTFTLQIGDWLVNNSTATQKIANTLVSATTTQQGTIVLAGDLQNTYDAPRVRSLNAVALPALPPTGAGKYLRSASVNALEYAAIPAADLPSATTAAAGVIQLGGDLSGTATAQTVAKVNGWTVGNTPTTINQVLAVTDVANKTLGYVAQSGGGGLAAEYMFAKRDSQTTGLTSNSNILFNSVNASAGTSVALNTSTGVFTLKAGRTYHLMGSVPFAAFSADGGYMAVQWYNITASAWIGEEGSTQPITRPVNEGKTCIFNAIVSPSTDITVAARFAATGGANLVTGIYNSNVSIQVLAGSSPVTGQTVDYAFGQSTTSQAYALNGVVTFDSSVGSVPFAGNTWTLQAGVTYELIASVRQLAAAGYDYMWYNVTTSSYVGSRGSGSNSGTEVIAAYTFTPSVTTQVRVQFTAGSGTAGARFVSIKQLGTSSVINVVGATASTPGVAGTVPAPAAGKQRAYLKGDGTWDDGAWTSYTPTITGSISNPTLATTKTLIARYRVVGKSLQIAFTYYAASSTGAAAGSGAYLFSLPAGFTIDTTAAPIAASTTSVAGDYSGFSASSLGNGIASTNSASTPCIVVGSSTTTVSLAGTFTSAGASVNTLIGSGSFTVANNNCCYKFTAEIPIV